MHSHQCKGQGYRWGVHYCGPGTVHEIRFRAPSGLLYYDMVRRSALHRSVQEARAGKLTVCCFIVDDVIRPFQTLMAGKVKNSGYPDEFQTEEERAAYLQRWADKHGIVLRDEEMQKNPALARIYKLL